MCIGMPARVVSVNAASAIVEALGMKKTVTTRLLGELQPGDFVTVHADIAYGRISREEYDTAKVLWKKHLQPFRGNSYPISLIEFIIIYT